ncbi:MAG TPA: phytanoyl-CoA dioxygenase family protein [Ilumatobacteraceae bacterium]|nr:phytanoyl-CoA dioxygenase family protein [Ilumatobacteraceae bacterium]
MILGSDQLAAFHRDGVIVIPGLFSGDEVDAITARLPRLFAERCPENFRERSSDVVRTAMGLHGRDPLFARLVRDPRLVLPAQQILDDDELYIQQVKVNAKEAFTGEQWQWHYDFATHHHEDGVPEPLALNLHIFLDEVTEFNGPLVFIRGSQLGGPAPTALDTATTSYPLWTVAPDVVAPLAERGGLYCPKGPPGTVLIFGDTMVHSSPPNMSPWDRRIFSLILNPVRNHQTTFARPDHQHHRDFAPVTALDDSFLDPRWRPVDDSASRPSGSA